MIRQPPRSTLSSSSAASDVYKRQHLYRDEGETSMGGFTGTLATLAALGLYGFGIKMGLDTPLPGQEQDVAEGLAVELREFETADGLKLRLKRYANPGGTPVLMCHGFSGTGFAFD